MTLKAVTPMHHLMTMVSSVASGLRRLTPFGGYRDPEQGLRPGLHLEASRPRPWPGTRPATTSRPPRTAASPRAAGGARRAKALGLQPGQLVERKPYDLLFGERKAPDGTQLGRPPGNGRKAADIYTALLAAEPHATAGAQARTRLEADPAGPAKPPVLRPDPVDVEVDLDLPRVPRRERPPGPRGGGHGGGASTGRAWSPRSTR